MEVGARGSVIEMLNRGSRGSVVGMREAVDVGVKMRCRCKGEMRRPRRVLIVDQ